MNKIGQVVRQEPSIFGFNIYGVGKGYSIGVLVNEKLTIPRCEILQIFENNTAKVKIDGYNDEYTVDMNIIKTKPRHIDKAIVL